ncbi:MAG: hypothetical protein AAFO74_12745 [Pseudomonadota bacterium]
MVTDSNGASSKTDSRQSSWVPPILIIPAVVTWVASFNDFVEFYKFVDVVLEAWREILRSAWSPIFEFFNQFFGVSIDEKFSELLSFSIFVFLVGIKARGSSREIIKRPRDLIGIPILSVFAGFFVWMILSAGFFIQLFDLDTLLDLRIISVVPFASLFVFGLPLLIFAIVPRRWNFASKSANAGSRIGAISVLAALVFLVFQFNLLPSSMKSLTGQPKAHVLGVASHPLTGATPPEFRSIPQLRNNLVCRSFDQAKFMLGNIKPVDPNFHSNIEQFGRLMERQDLASQAIDNALKSLNRKKAVRSMWGQIEAEPSTKQNLIHHFAYEAFLSRNYFSYSFLSALNGADRTAIQTEDYIYRVTSLSAEEKEHYSRLRPYLDQYVNTGSLSDYLNSYEKLEYDWNPEKDYDVRRPGCELKECVSSHFFELGEFHCTYSGIMGHQCHFVFPENSEHLEQCLEFSHGFDDTCAPSEKGAKIRAGLWAATGALAEFEWVISQSSSAAIQDAYRVNGDHLRNFTMEETGYFFEGFQTYSIISTLLDLENSIPVPNMNEAIIYENFYFSWPSTVQNYQDWLEKTIESIRSENFILEEQIALQEAELELEAAKSALDSFVVDQGIDHVFWDEQLTPSYDEILQLRDIGKVYWRETCSHVEEIVNQTRSSILSIPKNDWRVKSRIDTILKPLLETKKDLPFEEFLKSVDAIKNETTHIRRLVTTDQSASAQGSAVFQKQNEIKLSLNQIDEIHYVVQFYDSPGLIKNELIELIDKSANYYSQQYVLQNSSVILLSLFMTALAVGLSMHFGLFGVFRIVLFGVVTIVSVTIVGAAIEIYETRSKCEANPEASECRGLEVSEFGELNFTQYNQ